MSIDTGNSTTTDHWFYVQDGTQCGPIGTAALRTMTATGQIKATDLVWRHGMSDWASAARIKGLFPESVAALAPPPLPGHGNGRVIAKPASKATSPLDDRYSGFYCSSDDKMVLGLAGGLAHKFGVPSSAMRFLVFFVFMFVAWIPYLVGLFLPKLPTKGVPRPS
jgi:phage shock protein PspC (stress-responsive transcriptional regulator)